MRMGEHRSISAPNDYLSELFSDHTVQDFTFQEMGIDRQSFVDFVRQIFRPRGRPPLLIWDHICRNFCKLSANQAHNIDKTALCSDGHQILILPLLRGYEAYRWVTTSGNGVMSAESVNDVLLFIYMESCLHQILGALRSRTESKPRASGPLAVLGGLGKFACGEPAAA